MSTANSLEHLMLMLINAERAAVGINPLVFDDNLNDASEDHSRWMLIADTFSHTGAGGSSPHDRMATSGFKFEGTWASGENIGFQSEHGDPGLEDDVAAIHQSLMNSPGHRANILNPNFDEIGIGIERGDYSTNGATFDSVMITQNFARTDAVDLTPPVPTDPTLVLSPGAQVISGSVTGLDSNVYEGFGTDDTIVLTGDTATRVQVEIIPDRAIIDLDLDRDGVSDGTIMLEGDFSGGDFMTALSGGDTVLSYHEYLALSERHRLADTEIKGITNQAYLSGENANSFDVTIQTGSGASYHNSIGAYEVDAGGNIVDVRFLSANAKNDAGQSFTVDNVEDGHDLGFFLIQDGDRQLEDSVLSSNNLSFVRLTNGAMALAEGGQIVGNAKSFLSHDSALNFDGSEHATSSVIDDGSGGMMIGFEDLTYASNIGLYDGDFEDVVLHVEAIYDFV